MLTAKQQAVIDLRQRGWSCRRIAEHLGITRNNEKQHAWQARRKIKAGNPLTLSNMGVSCLFRFGPHIGVLPLRLLPKWVDTVWKVKNQLPMFAELKRRPKLEILLGGVVQLTFQQARAARRLLAPRRKPGVYRIGPRGKVTAFSGEKAAARTLGVRSNAIRQYRERGHERGRYFWL